MTSAIKTSALTEWMAISACRDRSPEMFFPEDGAGVKRAQKVCAICPVATQCLDYALDHRIDQGVWGGVSERGRRRILRGRSPRPFDQLAS